MRPPRRSGRACRPRSPRPASTRRSRSCSPAGRSSSPRALHLDLPERFDYGTTVPLAVTVDSPMTEADHVRRVSVFAEGNPFPEVASVHFTPGQRPGQRLDPDPAQRGQAGGRRGRGAERRPRLARPADDRGRDQRLQRRDRRGGRLCHAAPEPRLKVPAEARRDEIVEIRTMISHWMETGLRIDAAGNPIPRRIINRMVCAPRRRADLRRRPDPGDRRQRLSELSHGRARIRRSRPSPGARTAAPSTAPAIL